MRLPCIDRLYILYIICFNFYRTNKNEGNLINGNCFYRNKSLQFRLELLTRNINVYFQIITTSFIHIKL